ncbi:MAG: hypothetical protein AABX32_02315 [Nanoarchaeota archaeon]
MTYSKTVPNSEYPVHLAGWRKASSPISRVQLGSHSDIRQLILSERGAAKINSGVPISCLELETDYQIVVIPLSEAGDAPEIRLGRLKKNRIPAQNLHAGETLDSKI